ncbi:MAG: sugar kinase [Pseudomonadota bacterium]
MKPVLCLGEPLVEFNQQSDGRWLQGCGGDTSNVAVAVARQGTPSGMIARLGSDAFADSLFALWQAEGVDVRHVVRDPAAPTGIYFVHHDAAGHHFSYRRAGSAASLMRPDQVPYEAIRGAALLHASGISLAISDNAADSVFCAIAAARDADVPVSFDPNLRLNLWPIERARALIHAAMAQCDLALPGLDDARQLSGRDSPEDVAQFYLDLGAKIVALTLGAEGALVATKDGIHRVPPRPTTLVDASGAGDCFDGAFIARWLETGDPHDALGYANCAAAISVRDYGAVAPVPRADAVLAELAAA